MSAFPDQPDHFSLWLAEQPRWMPKEGWSPKSFAPRRLYRDYLTGLLAPYLADAGRLRVVRQAAVDIVETDRGVAVSSRDGATVEGEAVVLATGNEGPGLPPAERRFECWAARAGYDIPAAASVAIIGTGLSMVDSVISLLDAGHAGPLVALSRRGLLPQPQAGTEACPLEPDEIPFGVSLSRLGRWLRDRVRQKKREQGMDWRCVIDGLRPHSQEVWRRLSHADKRRFLRHARPWWDIHRHRMAPQIRTRIDAAIESGQLAILRGRIRELSYADDGATLRFAPRGGGGESVSRPDFVIECRGQNTDVGATRNPLLRSLFERGAIRADPLKLGVDVTQDCAVIDAHGVASGRIFAIGPSTTGTFWEIVAVPDIRRQASRLAVHVLAPPP